MLTVKVSDGGPNTQLEKYVGQIDGDPLWTSRYVAKNPDAIIQSHLDFYRAGSQIVLTHTYQASLGSFMKYLNVSEEEALRYLRKAGLLALEAKEIYMKENPEATNLEVFGSIGPYGAFLLDGSEYTGEYTERITPEMIKELHRPRIEQLMSVGITKFAFETIPSKKEAFACIELMKEYPTIKGWVSFSCKDDKCISNGDDFKSTVIECYKKNPDQILAVGANCLPPKYVYNLINGINEDSDGFVPLVVYSNSGEAYNQENGWSFKEDVKPIYSYVEDWIKLGVRYVGGCCRTNSNDLTMIAKEVKNVIGKTKYDKIV